VFTPESIHLIPGQLQTAHFTSTVARAFSVALLTDGPRFDLAVHVNEDTIVIECEPCIDEQGVNSSALVRAMIARLQQTADLRTFYRVAAREMRGLTGFDRVMVYRFDHDGSGEVIAESTRGGLDSYLGLHYPASDIPRQARILYERNWLRIIPDVSAVPVAIEPAVIAGQPLNLSMSTLRSVSPIHIEYLRNMGIGASMSVSILRDGKLWGLFACHHYVPHTVPFERRTAAELFGQMFSLLMESRERDEESAYEARARTLHNRLVTVMAAEATRFDSIVSHLDEIADLLSCDGIGVWTGGKANLQGMAPTRNQFAGLIDYLACHDLGEVLAIHEIAAEYPPGHAFAEGSVAHGELGGRSQQAGRRRPARRASDAAQELRTVAGDGERPVGTMAAGRRAHRREPAGQPARGHPAPLRHHRGRAQAVAGAAGAADRRAQPPGPQHPGPDPRRHLAEPRPVTLGRCLRRRGRRSHPGAGTCP
jgi:light-regulated signal transduction histidine kinase (bacteriophytochrome)